MTNLFYSLLLIATVWFGIQMMFGGGLDMRGFVGWLLTASFAAGTLVFYYSPSPVATIFGPTQGLAHLIAQGGIYVS